MLKTALALVLMISTLSSYAEYRVYQYYIRPKVQNIAPPNGQVVTSTLNPESYKAYNGGKSSVELTLLRSWMCMGNTAYEDVCTISDGNELSVGATK